jgi:HPt (histidine-containing phosphotransfer) domain-containing protein
MAQYATAQKLDPTLDESAAIDAGEDMVIDLVHLSRQTLGDIGLETELLRLFEGQARAFAVRLRAPVATGQTIQEMATQDIKQRIVLAHTLKGASRAIGAFALADAAEAYEDALRLDAPSGELSLRRLVAALERAQSKISQLL